MQTGGGGGGGGSSPTPTPSPTPPPVCTATYPGAATLTYPPNNGQVSGSQVTLQWQAPGDWGTGCPENNDHYLLNVYNMTDGQFVKDAGGNDYNHKWIGEGQTSETVPLDAARGNHRRHRKTTENPEGGRVGARRASPAFGVRRSCRGARPFAPTKIPRTRIKRGAAPLCPYETLSGFGNDAGKTVALTSLRLCSLCAFALSVAFRVIRGRSPQG